MYWHQTRVWSRRVDLFEFLHDLDLDLSLLAGLGRFICVVLSAVSLSAWSAEAAELTWQGYINRKF